MQFFGQPILIFDGGHSVPECCVLGRTNSQVKAVLTYLAEHWLKMAVDLECAQPWPEGFEPSAKD
jgi:hypothetical protein